MPAPPCVVGIDLGTTHTVVASAPKSAPGNARVFDVSQFVADGRIAPLPLLPSVLFAPLAEETTEDPWGDAPWIVGEHARVRAERLPGRAVTSPKSWLCHPGIDRLAKNLPWGKDEADTPKLSPVEASRRILGHVKHAYDAAHPDGPLAEQEIVLTVPASFDEVARELTVRAAREAGLSVRLLEEPLAAFYGYLATHGDAALRTLIDADSKEAFVLVADIGGGTTDLTLVRARPDPGGVRLDRVAVGRHLLLGGDNMDLALAHAVEQALPQESRLEPALFSELLLACRSAKERLLGDAPPDEETVRVLGRGSQLVGATHTATLTRARAEAIVVEGFFPLVDEGAVPHEPRAALVGFGLPYERDPAITRHVAAFVRRHLPEGVGPDAVLLNGGVVRSKLVRKRLFDALASRARRPLELPSADPDLAVARGAVAFGLALSGVGIYIGGGSARGYYIGLAPEGGERRAICVVPRGASEGERHVVALPGLSLVVGQPVRFDLYTSDAATHAPSAIVALDAGFDALPSMMAAFDARSERPGNVVPVHLEGELTAVGTLDVACVEDGDAAPAANNHRERFRLAFDLGARPALPSVAPASLRPSRRASGRPPDGKLDPALLLVARVFGKGRADVDSREARHLFRELEKLLGDRAEWSTEATRAIADLVIAEPKARKRSVDHERMFWMLAGYCLRPGYGHPLDERRVGKLVPLLPELVLFPDEARTWPQFWIAWRRIAGGLAEPAQTKLRGLLDPFLSTDEPKPKRPKAVRPQGLPEMLDLAASLERVPAARRADLGRWVLERTWSDRDPRLWLALSRVGARVPTYASAHHVVATTTVERWLDHLLRERWPEVKTAARAAVQMARVTGDRARDISESLRADIAKRLQSVNAPPEWVRAVRELVALDEADQAEFFGESLPVGLLLGDPAGGPPSAAPAI